MTLNGFPLCPCEGKTVTLYSGNIMIEGGRAGYLNTSMSKNNAEVHLLINFTQKAHVTTQLVSSLKNIRPWKDDEGVQWQWKEGSNIRLEHPDTFDELLTEDASRSEFDITGLVLEQS